MSAIAHDMAASLARVLATEGMPGVFVRATQANEYPEAGIPVRFLMRHPGVRDEVIANAYGVNAQIITLPHCYDFNAKPPQKFDAVVEGEAVRYVFDAVLPRVVGGCIVAWTAYCRGSGA